MLRTRWIDLQDALADAARWQALADTCTSANVFFEPWAVNACQTLPEGKGLHLLLVEDRDGSWLALLPLMPWRVGAVTIGWQNWDQRVRALGDPLIRRGYEAKAWQAMLAMLAGDWRQPMLRLSTLDEQGPIARALADCLAQGSWPYRITRRLERAVLNHGPAAADYCAVNIRGKVLKEYRRLKRRLADRGDLRIERLSRDMAATGWTDELLAMEAAGWKGRDNVAAACDPVLHACVHRLLDEAHQRGRLDFWRMTLDGDPLSMLACLENGQGQAYQYKISYDERHAASSPGVLLELEYLHAMLDEDRLVKCDSCARPDHPMINRLWVDRMSICSLVIGQPTMVGRGIVGLTALLERRAQTSGTQGVTPPASKPPASATTMESR
jgi:Acetyltransferase (GNAT) domain